MSEKGNWKRIHSWRNKYSYVFNDINNNWFIQNIIWLYTVLLMIEHYCLLKYMLEMIYFM